MTSRPGDARTDLERKVTEHHGEPDGLDGLHLVEVPLVPEIRLHLAEDAIVWWARMEAEAGHSLAAPYWASAWAGGQAVARYVLDHPETAAGCRVLDLASGSGLVAIAAALAGASAVTATDIDPYAVAAITLNAAANGVAVDASGRDVLDTDGDGADLVLAGDVFYDPAMADRMLPFLDRVVARGGRVLVGDPGRGTLPWDSLEVVASYPAPTEAAFADAELARTYVLRLSRS
ncbi:class I SAM-dependent methyltransferase [Polymorphospora rubra]|uniref:class I SAM-dependent methyltransferase n=1 Tax=Polymorphospora rubra TaxID=338584 RepID=UPI0033D8252C